MQARSASQLTAAHRFGLASRGAAVHRSLAAPPPPPLRKLGVRCMASSKGDKSWSEIAAEAGQLAT